MNYPCSRVCGSRWRDRVQGGVRNAQGFYVNVSNYQLSPNLAQYATWISDCIAFANDPEEGGWRLGHYDWCNSQYFPVVLSAFSPWGDSAQSSSSPRIAAW